MALWALVVSIQLQMNGYPSGMNRFSRAAIINVALRRVTGRWISVTMTGSNDVDTCCCESVLPSASIMVTVHIMSSGLSCGFAD